jgi:GntR family transcriptional repressor for pyruvate dehydrogenase complex
MGGGKASKRRLSEAIAHRIRKAIADGKVTPGEKLPAERELAERLKTSRVSVREAYRSLEEAGLIFIRRGAEGGAFIAEFDHAPVSRNLAFMLRLGRTSHQELTEARLLLEPPVARLAARRAGPQDLEQLGHLLGKQQAALAGDGEPRRYDFQFHRLVAQCAKNLPLAILMNSMADLAVEAVHTFDITRDVDEHNIGFHARIFEAIRRRDEDAAHRLMLRHVRDVQGRLRRAFEAQLGRDAPVAPAGSRPAKAEGALWSARIVR